MAFCDSSKRSPHGHHAHNFPLWNPTILFVRALGSWDDKEAELASWKVLVGIDLLLISLICSLLRDDDSVNDEENMERAT